MTLAKLPPHIVPVVRSARRLAEQVPAIVAICLVGSWARGAGRLESDVDLVVLTDDTSGLLDSEQWFSVFDQGAELTRTSDFGAIQERRLRLDGGVIVEVGVGKRSWAATVPVDPGTARVVRDGLIPLYDPHGVLVELIAAVAAP